MSKFVAACQALGGGGRGGNHLCTLVMLNDILLILLPMSYADLSTARQLACYRIGFIGCDIGPTCFVSHSMSGSDDA